MKTRMKLTVLASLAASALTVSAQSFNFPIPAGGTPIPDGGTITTTLHFGTADSDSKTAFQSGAFSQGLFLRVGLSIVGDPIAVNSDYYVQLSHQGLNNQSQSVILLNRPGKSIDNPNGYGDNGMVVTLQDFLVAPRIDSGAAPDIHTYRTVGGYDIQANQVWAPDGRSTNPANGNTEDPRGSLLSVFKDVDPNGSWYLLVSDAGAGTYAGKLTAANLEFLVAVPEPHQYALIAGLALIGFAAYRRFALKAA